MKSYQIQIDVTGVAGAARDLRTAAAALKTLGASNPMGALKVPTTTITGLQTLASNLNDVATAAAKARAEIDALHASMGQKPKNYRVPNAGGGGGGNSGGGGWTLPALPVGGRLGQLSGMLGPLGRAAGPIGIALGAAALQVKVFTDVLKQATETLTAFRNAGVISGGTSENVGFLRSIGISPSQIPGLSAGVRSSLTTDPFAISAGARLGLGPQMPRPFGDTNEAKLLEKLVRNTASLGSQSERLRTLRSFGLEGLAPAVENYRRFGGQIEQEKFTTNQIFDKDTQRAAADVAFQFGKLGENFQLLMGAAAKPFLKDAALALQVFNRGIVNLASIFEKFGPIIAVVVKSMNPLLMLMDKLPKAFEILRLFYEGLLDPSKMAGNIKEAQEIIKGNANNTNAINANTAAISNNTAVLTRQGTFGGGQRAGSAVTSAQAFSMGGRGMAGESLRLGAYALW